jgi:UDP-glucose 4-epimerase
MMLSVMIPCYNFEPYIEYCVESVLSQVTDFDFEVIVGDDCSTDGTHLILDRLSDRIKFYTNETNLGIAKNTRKLLGMCRGKYVSYIDGDDFLTDINKLQRQVDFLESNPDYVMHSTGCFYSNDKGEVTNYITPLLEEPTSEQLAHVNYVGFGRTFRNMPGLSPEWMDEIKFHDWAMNFEISLRGKIRCEQTFTGGYRILGTGIITGLSESEIGDSNSKCSARLVERMTKPHKPKAVVTGGCGFIGGHLVDRLVSDGFDVLVIDDLSSSDADFHFNDRAKYVNVDVTDSVAVDSIIEDVDYVFHMAAESRIQPSILNPQRAYSINVLGTLNVVNSCVRKGVKRLIYSSTSSIYGLSEIMPSVECQPVDCQNPYSHSKMLGEEVIKQANKTYGLDCVILRYFNVFGERAPIKGSYALVIGIFLNDATKGENLKIVGDGSKRRDFVHVLDVVESNILATRSLLKFDAEILNIGTGRNYSIKDIADEVSSNQIHIEDRVGEATETLADIRAAESRIGYKPSVDVIEWIKSKKR